MGKAKRHMDNDVKEDDSNSNQGSTGSSHREDSSPDLSNAARTMRTDPDPKKRSDAASLMGQQGGHNSHGGHGNSNNKQEENVDPELSKAAHIMRTSPNPDERKEAASKMGREGGKHSHDRDPGRKDNKEEE